VLLQITEGKLCQVCSVTSGWERHASAQIKVFHLAMKYRSERDRDDEGGVKGTEKGGRKLKLKRLIGGMSWVITERNSRARFRFLIRKGRGGGNKEPHQQPVRKSGSE